ncbi:MAG TPA: hypothetical protein PK867_12295 [Pirellulales bacterium]|nr:hypothetical protein [Pirellulales bacterium]
MELNRNHYFMAGVVLVLLGMQLRFVDSFVLNEQTTRMLNQPSSEGMMSIRPMLQGVTPMPRKVIKPPQSLGWALMSIGSVLILHALAMKPPGAEPQH